jgi:D-lyxose ketol-isomerase
MKRSEINRIITESKQFLKEKKFNLPPWAFWQPADWKGKYESCREIVDNMLGWDITDFGKDDFYRTGLILFTIRNGHPESGSKTYCEKIMIVHENQITPMHFHWAKTEDIINRSGGKLVLEIYQSNSEQQLTDNSFHLSIDGVQRLLNPGEKVILTPGESITFEPYIAHRFYGEDGKGSVLVGEVSTVNDDNADNCFVDGVGRFPDIEEDEEPLHLLVSDYQKYI